MTAITNVKNLQQYEDRFSLIEVKIPAFAFFRILDEMHENVLCYR